MMVIGIIITVIWVVAITVGLMGGPPTPRRK